MNKLGNKLYLKPELVVHHKDMNKKNNQINNLQIMTLEKHARLNSQLRKRK